MGRRKYAFKLCWWVVHHSLLKTTIHVSDKESAPNFTSNIKQNLASIPLK